jgi:hypothetical protein
MDWGEGWELNYGGLDDGLGCVLICDADSSNPWGF